MAGSNLFSRSRSLTCHYRARWVPLYAVIKWFKSRKVPTNHSRSPLFDQTSTLSPVTLSIYEPEVKHFNALSCTRAVNFLPEKIHYTSVIITLRKYDKQARVSLWMTPERYCISINKTETFVATTFHSFKHPFFLADHLNCVLQCVQYRIPLSSTTCTLPVREYLNVLHDENQTWFNWRLKYQFSSKLVPGTVIQDSR